MQQATGNPFVKSPRVVGAVIGLIAGAAVFMVLTGEAKKERAAIESQVQNAKTSANRSAATGTPATAEEEKAWKAAAELLDAKLLPAVDSGATLLDLYNAGRAAGIKDVSVNADSAEQRATLSYTGSTMTARALPAGIQVLRVRVTGTSDYPSLMKYLRSLENMKPVVEVRGLDVRQENPMPSFELTLWTYFKSTGRPNEAR
jgi:hypothetical protein